MSQYWWTPPEICDAARHVLGGIDLDPASADDANTRCVRATKYYTETDNGLAHPWPGRVWLNPPFGRGVIDRFSAKLINEIEFGRCVRAIALVNVDPSTKWFQALAKNATAIGFFNRRVRFFHGDPDHPHYGERSTAGQQRAQCLIGLRVDRDVFLRAFSPWCWFAFPEGPNQRANRARHELLDKLEADDRIQHRLRGSTGCRHQMHRFGIREQWMTTPRSALRSSGVILPPPFEGPRSTGTASGS